MKATKRMISLVLAFLLVIGVLPAVAEDAPVQPVLVARVKNIIEKDGYQFKDLNGNGMWQIYRKIVVPNTKLATITTFVFQCTSIWNEMLFALVLANQGEGAQAPLATIVLNSFVGSTGVEINQLMAGSMILALPMLIIYIFMGKYLISGQMSGAVTAS